jgi:hypothetical protein
MENMILEALTGTFYCYAAVTLLPIPEPDCREIMRAVFMA